LNASHKATKEIKKKGQGVPGLWRRGKVRPDHRQGGFTREGGDAGRGEDGNRRQGPRIGSSKRVGKHRRDGKRSWMG